MVGTVTLVEIAASFVAGGLVGRWLGRRDVVGEARHLPPPAPMAENEYVEHRKNVIRSYKHGQQQFDRLIPWGSGGALLLSVGVLERLIRHPLPGTTVILAAGWAALFIALATAIFGHQCSTRAYESELNAIDLAQKGQLNDDERGRHLRLTRTTSTMDSWTRVCNWTSMIGFLGGVALLIVFAFVNL